MGGRINQKDQARRSVSAYGEMAQRAESGSIQVCADDWKKLFVEAGGQLDKTIDECQRLQALLRELYYEVDVRPGTTERKLRAALQVALTALREIRRLHVTQPYTMAAANFARDTAIRAMEHPHIELLGEEEE